MIARRTIPQHYTKWNQRFHAPYGRQSNWTRFLLRYPGLSARFAGPFGIQSNNSTRTFEYPWAFHAAPLAAGMRIVEVGGSLSGFQFVLSKLGCTVINVDPGSEAQGVGWPCDHESLSALNNMFGTNVELRNTTVPKAELEDRAYDRAYCISVLEHIDPVELPELIAGIHRCLKPGGLLIVTADLFLDLHPFTSRQENRWGRNLDLRALISGTGFELDAGDPRELYNFPEFDPDRVQANLGDYLYGTGYPTLAQCLILRKGP